MDRILELQEASRIAIAVKADSYGRRRSVRIASPPLTIVFEDGQECRTIDWSTYGILVAGFRGNIINGEQITVTVRSADVEGGGTVSGRVVWCSSDSDKIGIEFPRPSLSIQVIKIRMMRLGLIEPKV
ncbi:MAG: PilZ domain-containing protein [Rhodospirillaceae bacterium]